MAAMLRDGPPAGPRLPHVRAIVASQESAPPGSRVISNVAASIFSTRQPSAKLAGTSPWLTRRGRPQSPGCSDR